MTHTLKNLSRRLVSFCGNSGQTWHVAPNTSIELPDFELIKNDKIRKLDERHLIKVVPPLEKEASPPKPAQSEPDDDGPDRGKKAKAKR
jgi:hypothetical protein